jgi:hypothetical protein
MFTDKPLSNKATSLIDSSFLQLLPRVVRGWFLIFRQVEVGRLVEINVNEEGPKKID